MVRPARRSPIVAAWICALAVAGPAAAQTLAPSVPKDTAARRRLQAAYDEAMREANKASFFRWSSDSKFVHFWDAGKPVRFDVAAKKIVPEPPPAPPAAPSTPAPASKPARVLRRELMPSFDGEVTAFIKDRNVWIGDTVGDNAVPITTDGGEATRVKYGMIPWVYDEELGQRSAIWWSPVGRKIAFYRFDESKIADYYLVLDQKQIHAKLSVEAYPKAGDPNPEVDLFVYDADTKKLTKLDIRRGKPFEDDAVGYYAYGIEWTPDGRELTMLRMNRLQKVLEFTACDVGTGACRVIVHDEWQTGWVDWRPGMTYLEDHKRFVWQSPRTGFENLYLYDMSGKLLQTLTRHEFDVGYVVRVDEAKGVVYYTATSGDNHALLQIHRVGLNGRGDKRLTDPAFFHTATVSPDGKYYIDIAQRHDQPASAGVYDADGRFVASIVKGDASKLWALGFRPAEVFTFKAADDTTTLHGVLNFPQHFDSTKRYPIVLGVYAGPGTNAVQERFWLGSLAGEHPYLNVMLDSRTASLRGRRFIDATYGKLGIVEVDDQVAGIKALLTRPYVDATRVGIAGSSYGGYVSIMAILRYPDVFASAYASSAVTDWRNYDTIWTERHMGLPSTNPEGYEAASAMKYVQNLRGRLFVCYGTVDNNVHPANTLQLADALKTAGKTFQLAVDTDVGHGANCAGDMEEVLLGK